MKYFSKFIELNEIVKLSATNILKKLKKKEIEADYLVDIFVKQISKSNKRFLAFNFFNKELIYDQVEKLKKKILIVVICFHCQLELKIYLIRF